MAKESKACGETTHIAASCSKCGNKNLYAVDEDEGQNSEEAVK